MSSYLMDQLTLSLDPRGMVVIGLRGAGSGTFSGDLAQVRRVLPMRPIEFLITRVARDHVDGWGVGRRLGRPFQNPSHIPPREWGDHVALVSAVCAALNASFDCRDIGSEWQTALGDKADTSVGVTLLFWSALQTAGVQADAGSMRRRLREVPEGLWKVVRRDLSPALQLEIEQMRQGG